MPRIRSITKQPRQYPDNAKYWFRQVGTHPVYEALQAESAKLGWKEWDAAAFVDECERHRDSGSLRETLVSEVQQAE